MIIQSTEEFAGEVQGKWAGREVKVSKTTNMTPINIRIESARVAEWKEVDCRIKQRHEMDTKFFVIAGKSVDELEKGNIKRLVIPVDERTVYDVREERFVVLTEKEVVEFSLVGK
ncbi:MAG: hypothetical protein ACOY46_12910 [Bacillota bacterium]